MREATIRCSRGPWPRFLALFTVVVVAAGLGAHAASDYFLKIQGLPGESKAQGHADQIDVLSWSWGESRSTGRAAKHTTPEMATVRDVTVTKQFDSASPLLMEACGKGNALGVVVLHERQADGSTVRYELEDAIVSSYTIERSGRGAGSVPTESVTLNFAKIRQAPQAPAHQIAPDRIKPKSR